MIPYVKNPFPRPKNSRRNVFWIFLIGVLCSVFILVFKPFSIENTTGELYAYVVLFSLGILFSVSIYVWDFLIPSFFPNPFKKWTLGKAVLWYSLMILFVGGNMFVYKSYWAGFNDFTFQEYLFVCGRVFLISLTVSFFVLGFINYVSKRQLSTLSSNDSVLVTLPNSKPVRLFFKEILFIESDDNYVDIHVLKSGHRKKVVLRSSLKNIEEQLGFATSPIFRCHRKYLININYFEIHSSNSRSMRVQLRKGETQIPVSKQYAPQINKLLLTRP